MLLLQYQQYQRTQSVNEIDFRFIVRFHMHNCEEACYDYVSKCTEKVQGAQHLSLDHCDEF